MIRERAVADVSTLPTVVFGERNLGWWGTVGFAVIEGIVSARDHLFMPGLGQIGITVWRPEALFLWSAEQPDHFEDISGFVDQKIAALIEHHTQLDEHQEWQERVRQRMAELGQQHGFAAAEPFKKIEV